ncbi:EpsG family protein [Alkaliphilus sp. B6464]|uniref:EpsG family protein n=1 Tax=Alkaliphilus sp. B6464 TaxID=2731219 RepID=UPI001BACDABE|nr:EpsG family protein [Alkaliphilus sp. B6464]QUH19066.1 EpsG family protein [Alkaliphilus sp. B6464]
MIQMQFIKKNNLGLNYITAFLILFSFAALRGNGNGDYFSYLRYSTYITSLDRIFDPNFPMEIGFRIISYAVNILGLHQQAVIVIMNFISLICVYVFIKRYSPDRMLSILLFLPLYFQFDMHAARTAVAIGITTFSLKYLYEKKLFKFIAIIFLASTFHKTAWILVIMYFIADKKVNKYIGIITILGAGLLSSFFSISNIILNILTILRLNTFAHRYYIYMQSEVYGYSYKLYDPRLLLVIGIYISAQLIIKHPDKLESLLINFIWVNALLMIMFSEHTVFVTRLTCYFNIYTIILVPFIVSKYRSATKHALYGLVKLSAIYIYIAYTAGILIGTVEYKLFFI